MIFIPFSWNSLDLWMGSISNRLLPVVREPRFQKVYTMGCLVSFRQANRVYIRVTPSCESFVNARSPLSRFILRREEDIFASPTPSSEFKAVSSVVRDKWSTRVVYSWWRYTRKVDVGKCIDRKIWKRVNYGIRIVFLYTMFFITALDLIYNGIESLNERCVTIRERYIIILDNFLFFFFFSFPSYRN